MLIYWSDGELFPPVRIGLAELVDNLSSPGSGATAPAPAPVSIVVRVAAIGRRHNRSDEMARGTARDRARNNTHAASAGADNRASGGTRGYGRVCYALLT